MNITDTRLDIIDNPSGKLRAFCSMTFNDEFVVKNFKIIEGNHGLFVAMPSRKLTKPCYRCDNRAFRNANYCDRCGKEFDDRSGNSHHDTEDTHSDIAFPIEDDFREQLEDQLIAAYKKRKQGGSGVNVEHAKDENYDLLDFDYEGHLADDSNGSSQDASDDQKTFETGTETSDDQPLTTDVFSEPHQPLTESVAPSETSGGTATIPSDEKQEDETSDQSDKLY